MSWIAEYDMQGREFPTCVHVTKTTGTTIHGATYVPIEDGKSVRAENAKLRELVRILVHCLNDVDCDKCPLNGNPYELRGEWAACDALLDRMRELGVEVDE